MESEDTGALKDTELQLLPLFVWWSAPADCGRGCYCCFPVLISSELFASRALHGIVKN